MGENNELRNRYLHVRASELLDGVTHTSFIPVNDNIKRLIEAIGENQLSVKDMLEAVGQYIQNKFFRGSEEGINFEFSADIRIYLNFVKFAFR